MNLTDAFPEFIKGISEQIDPRPLIVGVAMKPSR